MFLANMETRMGVLADKEDEKIATLTKTIDREEKTRRKSPEKKR